ncbi:MAG: universal stress protein [Xenococcus sp. (in: cyanobacteria)]
MNQNTLDTMPLVESVLLPTDLEFSQVSERAFAHALAIALLGETQFTILHVGPEHESDIEWTNYPSVRQTLERWGFLEAGSPQSAVFDKLRLKVRKMALRSRNPVKATTSFLDHEPTDLIVLATEGRKGAIRLFNRSNAEEIARWSRTMTLFVPANSKRDLVSLSNGKASLKKILIPVDWQPDCSGAVELAKRTAELMGDGKVLITLLHIGDSQPVIPTLREGEKWQWQVEKRQGEPVEEILFAAEKQMTDLIIMPTAGREGVLDVLRGSTTEQVLRKAPCPLLAVPAIRKF